MADEQPDSSNSAPKVDRQVLWLAIAGMSGLLILAIAALGMAFFLGRNQPLISITAGNNSQTSSSNTLNPAPSPGAAPTPQPQLRPDHGVEAEAHRMNGQITGAPNVLPGAFAVSGTRGEAPLTTRADTQSPPYYTTLSPVAKVQFRVRVMPVGPSQLQGPVPFRTHPWQTDADGHVAGVEATVPGADSDQDSYSFLPEVSYKASSGKGKVLSVSISNPRKTSMVNDLRAPKGFQFLVTDIRALNISSAPFTLDPDMFEIQDSDKVPYLVNPELLSADFPQSPIAPGQAGSFTASFLVPADASLVAFVAREPGDGLISSPLRPQ
jgi:hypothetical protein